MYSNFPITSTRRAMSYARRKSGASLATGVAVGLAVGAAAALLLTPKTGKETRQIIKDKTITAANTVKEKTASVAEAIKTKVEELKNKKCCCEETEECTCEDSAQADA